MMLLLLVGICLAVGYLLVRQRTKNAQQLPPLVGGAFPIVGHTPFLYKNARQFFLGAHNKYGGIYRIKLLWKDMVVISDRSMFGAYLKARESDLSLMEPTKQTYLSPALWGADENYFLLYENITAIKKMVTENFMDIMVEQAQRGADELPYEGEIDLLAFSRRIVARVVSIFMLGFDCGEPAVEKMLKFETLAVKASLQSFLFGPTFIKYYLGGLISYRREEFIKELIPIVHMARSGPATTAFLKHISSCVNKNNEPLTDREVAMMVNGTFFGGLATTSSGVSNMLYLAACFPDKAEKLLSEKPDSDLMHAWVMEASRFSSGFLSSSRLVMLENGYEVGGYCLPVGTSVMLDIKSASIESNEFNMPAEDTFAPERFLASLAEETKRFGILNWGSGIHTCPGKMFAIAQMKYLVHTLVCLINFSDPKTRFHYSNTVINPMSQITSDYRVHFKKHAPPGAADS